jgi:ATP adenylyltransferase/5',5'''-P-1,P-4-tetraphosphate phosphorylase II
MKTETQIYFTTQIGKQKPVTVTNKTTSCPFCNIEELENIIEQEDSIIFLKNKFPTLQDTLQTVLIETDECNGELSTYTSEHLHKVIKFGVRNWLDLEKSSEFTSVIFYKNHGPLSGGTIRHPHMQIVGLKNVDYKKNIKLENFKGITIYRDQSVDFNISTRPLMGFREINVNLLDMKDIDRMSDFIQLAVKYILNHSQFRCESYNLFFYHMENTISCKIVARYAVSPLFVGYAIPQVSDDLENVAEKVKELCIFNGLI